MVMTDTFTGTGSQSTFTLRNKIAALTGGSIQADAVVYQRYLNGFNFPNNSTFTLSTPPPNNSQIVVPGTVGLNFNVYDVATIAGVSGAANVNEQAFYLADDGLGSQNILVNTYTNVSGNSGIAILFRNLATAAGASTTWTQLACADASGNVLSYQATGTTLYVHNFTALTSTSASAAALTTTLVVNSASAFFPGDYFLINPGTGTQENPKILTINYSTNTITHTGVNYSHLANEIVVMNGLQLFARGTLPIGTLNGVALSFINLGLTFDCLLTGR